MNTMYQNVNTGEIWKLACIETIRTWRNEVKVYLKIYVFENGERCAEDLFFKHWRKVGNAPLLAEIKGESVKCDGGNPGA